MLTHINVYFKVIIISILISINSASVYGLDNQTDNSAELLMQQGLYAQAIEQYQKLLASYPEESYREKAILYQRIALAAQFLGTTKDALDALLNAGELAKKSGDKTLQYKITAELANVHIEQGNLNLAKNLLNKSLSYFEKNKLFSLESAIHNDFGRLFWREGDLVNAEKSFLQSYSIAKFQGDDQQVIRTRSNYALLMFKLEKYAYVKEIIKEIVELVNKQPDSRHKENYLIHLAELALAVYTKNNETDKALLAFSHARLSEVYTLAKVSQNNRNRSYALGLMGKLYNAATDFDKAKKSYDRAIFIAQQNELTDLIYRWQWYAGKLAKQIGEQKKAVQYYKSAHHAYQRLDSLIVFENLGNLRSQDSPSDFFYEMADLLLQESSEAKDNKKVQELLVNAVHAIENLKNSELQDYFKDNCVAQTRQRYLNQTSDNDKSSVILYPIAFEERLELIVDYGDKVKRYTQKVSKELIVETSTQFRKNIERRRSRDYLVSAKTLYDWTIRPYISELKEKGVSTIVIVPDINFHALPFAALHDGERFLIEDYAIALSPGIELTAQQETSRENISIVLSGLVESVQGYPALEHVETELTNIQNLYGGKILLDKEFNSKNIKQTLTEEQYSIAHLASHGEFTGNVNQSYILTYDGKISVNDISQYIGATRFQDQPIELLTLSACYTATGDEKAMLGLAGITVKSGARSALATLWPVNDIATSQLMTEFYTQLKNEKITKAHALAIAQRELLTDKRYRHPGYWSPFVLIGNWL